MHALASRIPLSKRTIISRDYDIISRSVFHEESVDGFSGVSSAASLQIAQGFQIIGSDMAQAGTAASLHDTAPDTPPPTPFPRAYPTTLNFVHNASLYRLPPTISNPEPKPELSPDVDGPEPDAPSPAAPELPRPRRSRSKKGPPPIEIRRIIRKSLTRIGLFWLGILLTSFLSAEPDSPFGKMKPVGFQYLRSWTALAYGNARDFMVGPVKAWVLAACQTARECCMEIPALLNWLWIFLCDEGSHAYQIAQEYWMKILPHLNQLWIFLSFRGPHAWQIIREYWNKTQVFAGQIWKVARDALWPCLNSAFTIVQRLLEKMNQNVLNVLIVLAIALVVLLIYWAAKKIARWVTLVVDWINGLLPRKRHKNPKGRKKPLINPPQLEPQPIQEAPHQRRVPGKAPQIRTVKMRAGTKAHHGDGRLKVHGEHKIAQAGKSQPY
ncbi:MAG: hypothetical protein Q9220_007671 [cf. Caloplaca sp. 1 TL-2023]